MPKVDVWLPNTVDETVLGRVKEGLHTQFKDHKLKFDISREDVEMVQIIADTDIFASTILPRLTDAFRDETGMLLFESIQAYNGHFDMTYSNGDWH